MEVKKCIYWLLFLCFQISFSKDSSLGSVSGIVVYKNGMPVEAAVVILSGTNQYTTTDEKGFFQFDKLTLGKTYQIEVKPYNFSKVIKQITLYKNNQKITIQLSENPEISLNEVVVSGKNKAEITQEKGYAMNVIPTEKVSFQNLQTTELLNRSAGIKIRQSAGMGSESTYYINGLSGNSVRLFIDGIPVRNYGRSFSIGSIPPALIERIEVYKGVLPTELAEDALGGGINVVLKKNIANNLTTSYSYGSFNTHQWDMNANYHDEKSGFVANLSSYHSYTDNNYKVWGDNVFITDTKTGQLKYIEARRFHDSYAASGIRGNLGFTRKKWADDFSLGFMFSKMQKDIQTGATMSRVYGSRETGSRSGMANLQYRKNNVLVKGLNFNTYTTYSLTYRSVTDLDNRIFTWEGKPMKDYKGDDFLNPPGYGEAGVLTQAENTERNLANRSNLRYQFLDNQSFSVSYFLDGFTRKIDDPMLSVEVRRALDTRQYRKQILGANYEGFFFDKRLKTSLFYKKYLQKVFLTEVRYARVPSSGTFTLVQEIHDRKVDHNGYGFALSFAISPKITLTSSAEKVIRLPSITELLGNTSDMVVPNYDLLPEHSRNLNVGFSLHLLDYEKHTLRAETNLFLRDVRDLIIQNVPRETDNSFSYTNLGRVSSKGIDFEIKYDWKKRFFVSSNVSYNEARFNLEYDPFGVRYFYYQSRLRNQPYFTSNTNAEYIIDNVFQPKSRLSVIYNFNYTHQFFLNWENLGSVNKTTIPAQPLHDVALTYTFAKRNIIIAFDVKNIFDIQTFDNFALQKPGRAFYGKITYSLFNK